MKIFRAFVLILAGAILLPAPSFGDNKNKRRIVPPTRKGAASELPTIRKVGGDSVTVGKKTYTITSFTRILVNGRKATLSIAWRSSRPRSLSVPGTLAGSSRPIFTR